MSAAERILHFLGTSVRLVPMVAPLFPAALPEPRWSPNTGGFHPPPCCTEQGAADSPRLFLLRLSAADLGMI